MPDPMKPEDLQDDFSANTPVESKELQRAEMQTVRRWLRLADQFIASDSHQAEDQGGPEPES